MVGRTSRRRGEVQESSARVNVAALKSASAKYTGDWIGFRLSLLTSEGQFLVFNGPSSRTSVHFFGNYLYIVRDTAIVK